MILKYYILPLEKNAFLKVESTIVNVSANNVEKFRQWWFSTRVKV